jgi:hypothetical protein
LCFAEVIPDFTRRLWTEAVIFVSHRWDYPNDDEVGPY